MRRVRILICALSGVAFWAHFAWAEPKTNDANADSVEKITRELYDVAHHYRETPSPSATQVERWRTALIKLTSRTMRLPDRQREGVQSLLANIDAFRDLLPTRQLAAPQPSSGRTTVKPVESPQPSTGRTTVKAIEPKRAQQDNDRKLDDGLQDISLPQAGEGGHTEVGVAFLKKEIDRFGAQYRVVKGQDSTDGRGADQMVEFARGTLTRTIEAALEVALEQFASNSYDPSTIHLSQGGGVSYLNYSPEENLLWAYDVATLGIRFESRVGGTAAPWQRWQGKLRRVAAEHGITLKTRVR